MIAHIGSHDIIIKDNIMETRKGDAGSYSEFGILLKSKFDPFGEEMNYNNTVSGNDIKNYKIAIVLSGKNY